MPFDVEFISFDDLKNKGLDNYDVVINAGFAGSAWSGGEQWKDEKVVSLLTEWVNNGGAFIGVNANRLQQMVTIHSSVCHTFLA